MFVGGLSEKVMWRLRCFKLWIVFCGRNLVIGKSFGIICLWLIWRRVRCLL